MWLFFLFYLGLVKTTFLQKRFFESILVETESIRKDFGIPRVLKERPRVPEEPFREHGESLRE